MVELRLGAGACRSLQTTRALGDNNADHEERDGRARERDRNSERGRLGREGAIGHAIRHKQDLLLLIRRSKRSSSRRPLGSLRASARVACKNPIARKQVKAGIRGKIRAWERV